MLTLKIELRVDVQDSQQEQVIKDAAKQVAKHLKTLAILMGGRRTPQIALYGSDFFSPEEEIDLADDLPLPEGFTSQGNE